MGIYGLALKPFRPIGSDSTCDSTVQHDDIVWEKLLAPSSCVLEIGWLYTLRSAKLYENWYYFARLESECELAIFVYSFLLRLSCTQTSCSC